MRALSDSKVIWGSIAYYYLLFCGLIISTGFFRSPAASQLWKFTMLMNWPLWSFFLCVCLRWKTSSFGRQRHFSETLLILSLVAILSFGMGFAPTVTYYAFGQTYDISYFDLIRFPFPVAMIASLTATLGVVSFNIGLATRRGDSASRTPKSALRYWWPVLRNFLLFVGAILQIQQIFGSNSHDLAFATLLSSTMIIPVLSHLYEKCPDERKVVLFFLGVLSIANLGDLIYFFSHLSIEHPFEVIAFMSAISVCFSSALGELESDHLDSRSMRRTRSPTYRLVIFLPLVAAIVTWFFSHAEISVSVHP